VVTFGFKAFVAPKRLKVFAPVLLEAGFSWIEVEDLEDHTLDYWQALDEIVVRYRPCLSVHCQYRHVMPASANADIRAASLAVLRRGIDLAAQLGASIAVMHGGKSTKDGLPPAGHPMRPARMAALADDRARYHRRLLDVLPELGDYAASRGVRLTVENAFLPWDLLRTPDEMVALLDGMDGQVGMCLDVGHAHVAGFAPEAFVKALGNRIWHTHLHGNDGQYDSHSPLAQSDERLARSVLAIIAANPAAGLIFESNLSGCSTQEMIADQQLLVSLLADTHAESW